MGSHGRDDRVEQRVAAAIRGRCLRWGVVVAMLVASRGVAVASDAETSLVMRVESEIVAGDDARPVARSLTLFRDGVAWDFLEVPAADADDALRLVEIVLHDPARERVVVVDPLRKVKTEIEALRLERLGASLTSWARRADDRLVRWAGGPDFETGLTETDTTLELTGPRVRYAVAHMPAPSSRAATAYREFADTALLLRALLHPGGIPPFPRLALNRRLEAVGALPCEVTLEIGSRLSPLGGFTERLTCRHRSHPRFLSSDDARIDEASAHVAMATAVDLADFMATTVAGDPETVAEPQAASLP
jgi:hypothetical protein